jgi:hypothetical protein
MEYVETGKGSSRRAWDGYERVDIVIWSCSSKKSDAAIFLHPFVHASTEFLRTWIAHSTIDAALVDFTKTCLSEKSNDFV